MENPEEILHSLEEFSKMKPKDIPRELEEYLKFVAKTGDPVYQWPAIKSLFREKLINVITEFYESCPSMEIPPCPNVEMFNYDFMKNFILEKLDTFSSAPFTLQRICELLTSPRKEYTRIDKYMRALEKNILVVSTMEPGGRRTENGEGIMNGIESDHDFVPEPGNEINVEEMDDSPSWPQNIQTNHISEQISLETTKSDNHIDIQNSIESFSSEKVDSDSEASTSNQELVCVQYVSIEPLSESLEHHQTEVEKEDDISITITPVSIEARVNCQAEPQDSEAEAVETIQDENKKSDDEREMENESKMDLQPNETIPDTSKETTPDSSKETPTSDIIAESTTDNIPLTAEAEPIRDQSPKTPPESSGIENISPESSVSSSENSPSESTVPSETSSSTVSEDDTTSLPVEIIKEKSEQLKEVSEIISDLGTDSLDSVDSTTNVSGDDKVDSKVIEAKDNNGVDSEVSLKLDDSNTGIPVVQDEELVPQVDSSTASESIIIKEVTQEEVTKTEESVNFDVQEEPRKVEAIEEKSECLAPEDKETPMEVDGILDESSETLLEKEVPEEEPQSEPPV